MGIKLTHQHDDGTSCYAIRSPRGGRGHYHTPLTQAGLVSMEGETFAVAYWGYTGRWHAYETNTGKEICSFPREFYEKFIKPFHLRELLPKPDCVPPQATTSAA